MVKFIGREIEWWLDFPNSSVGKESACDAGDPGLIPGSGRSAREGIGYPLQYSWASLMAQLVKNPLKCGRSGFNPWVGKIPWRRERLTHSGILAWRIPWTIHGITKSRARLSNFHPHTSVLSGFPCGSAGKESA